MTTPRPALAPEAARRAFYTLTVTRWLPIGFVVGIFVLLQTSRGLSTAQALSVTAITGLVTFALELPTSGFADALGRRPIYLAAAGLYLVTAAIYALAHSPWAFAAAAALMGVFRALDSGPLEAWFVDTVHESTPGADVDQELSRAGTWMGAAMAVGAILSGGLIWWHPVRTAPALDLAVWVFAALSAVHLVASALLMKESPRHDGSGTRAARVRSSIREAPLVIRDGIRLLARSRILLGLIVAEVAWSTGLISFESLMPLRLEELLGSTQLAGAVVGPAAAAGWALFGVGTFLAGLLSRRLGVARAAMIGRALNGIGAITIGLATGPAGLIVAYLFTYTTHGINGPPHSALLHRVASASNRSTVLSMNSMMAFLAFAIASPLAGWLAEQTSLAVAAVTVGVISVFGVLGYLPARRAEVR